MPALDIVTDQPGERLVLSAPTSSRWRESARAALRSLNRHRGAIATATIDHLSASAGRLEITTRYPFRQVEAEGDEAATLQLRFIVSDEVSWLGSIQLGRGAAPALLKGRITVASLNSIDEASHFARRLGSALGLGFYRDSQTEKELRFEFATRGPVLLGGPFRVAGDGAGGGWHPIGDVEGRAADDLARVSLEDFPANFSPDNVHLVGKLDEWELQRRVLTSDPGVPDLDADDRAAKKAFAFIYSTTFFLIATGMLSPYIAAILEEWIPSLAHAYVFNKVIAPALGFSVAVLAGWFIGVRAYDSFRKPGRPRRSTRIDFTRAAVTIEDGGGKRKHSFAELRALRLDEFSSGIRLGIVTDDDDLTLAEWPANNAEAQQESRGMARALARALKRPIHHHDRRR